jgi:hypothetical protein
MAIREVHILVLCGQSSGGGWRLGLLDGNVLLSKLPLVICCTAKDLHKCFSLMESFPPLSTCLFTVCSQLEDVLMALFQVCFDVILVPLILSAPGDSSLSLVVSTAPVSGGRSWAS